MNINQFLTTFMNLYIEMVPYLAFGLIVAGILKVTIKSQTILNHLGGAGFSQVVKAALLGVPLPLCSCSVVPTAMSLKERGASNGAVLSFLISTPQTGVESIAATWGMMGAPFALFRPLAAFITGIFGGSLAISHDKNNPSVASITDDGNLTLSFGEKIKEIFRYGFIELIDDIGINLLIGVLISAIITLFVPESFFTKFTGNPLLEMLVILIGAIPLYVCATASIPIAVALLIKGVSPGAAFLFLMAGPATNAATITVIFSKLGKKMGYLYLGSIIIGSVVLGTVLNWGYSFFNIDATKNLRIMEHTMENSSPLLIIAVIFFTLSLLYSIWRTKIKVPLMLLFKKRVKTDDSIVRIYKVDGMTCKNCAGHVTDAAKLLQEVADAYVDLESKELVVTGDVEEKVVQETINKVGYQYKGVDRGSDVKRKFSLPSITCNNCVNHVKEAVIVLDNVSNVTISLEEKGMTLTGIISDEDIIAAVEKAGYKIARI